MRKNPSKFDHALTYMIDGLAVGSWQPWRKDIGCWKDKSLNNSYSICETPYKSTDDVHEYCHTPECLQILSNDLYVTSMSGLYFYCVCSQ